MGWGGRSAYEGQRNERDHSNPNSRGKARAHSQLRPYRRSCANNAAAVARRDAGDRGRRKHEVARMSATPETVPNGLWPEGRRNKQAGAPAIVASNPAESSGNGRVRQFEARSVIVVSADTPLRQMVVESLKELRWRVREASGGAQAMMLLENASFEAMILDHWLPDLQVDEFAELVRRSHPQMDVLVLDGHVDEQDASARSASPRRNELLHAMREARRQIGDSTAPSQIIVLPDPCDVLLDGENGRGKRSPEAFRVIENGSVTDGSRRSVSAAVPTLDEKDIQPLPGVVGSSRGMREVARLVRLVASRTTTVLIE